VATFRTSAAGGGTSGSGDRTATLTPAVGDLWIVFACTSGNTNDTPTATDNNGGTYTRILCVPKNGSADRVCAFVRNALMPNTTSTTVTVATGSNTAGEIVIVAVSGMPQAGASAIRQSASQQNQAAAGTPAPAFSVAAKTENMTLGCVGNGSNPAGMTTPASWTERQDVGQSTPNTGLEVVTRDSGFTGTTVTWGSTSATAFADIIVELNTHSLIAAALAASGSLSGTLTGKGALSAALAATSSLTGALSGRAPISAALSATSTLTGTLSAKVAIAAALSATSALSGTLTGRGALSAALAAVSLLSGTLTTAGSVSAISANLSASSSLTGTLHNATPAPPPAPQVRRSIGGGYWRERRKEREQRLERAIERLETLLEADPTERKREKQKKFLGAAAGLLLTILARRSARDD